MTGAGIAAGGGWVPEFPGQRPPFEPGNMAHLRHGAFSRRITGPLAAAIAAEQLARPDCPLFLREASYASAIQAWAEAEATVIRLRERRDELEEAGAGGLDDVLTEVTETEETEDRPAPGRMARRSVTRQRESIDRALHRAEGRARSLRNDLGLSPLARARISRDILAAARPDLALIWAAQEDAERAG